MHCVWQLTNTLASFNAYFQYEKIGDALENMTSLSEEDKGIYFSNENTYEYLNT